MSFCPYFRQSSLIISFSEVPDIDFNSQYVSEHRVFLIPAQKNNFRVVVRINYCKQVLMTLHYFSDHTCLDLHLEPNFEIDLARKANTSLVSIRISHEPSCTCMEYHVYVHVHCMHDMYALQEGLLVWIYIQQRPPGKFMSSQTVSLFKEDNRWPQMQKQSQGRTL